jgi:hypothetical protein
MTSSTHGASTSPVEVGNIDSHGLWLLIDDKEYFLLYESFPWFQNATVGQIVNVELLHRDHLHWPDLDVDLSLDSLSCPESFPRIFK